MFFGNFVRTLRTSKLICSKSFLVRSLLITNDHSWLNGKMGDYNWLFLILAKGLYNFCENLFFPCFQSILDFCDAFPYFFLFSFFFLECLFFRGRTRVGPQLPRPPGQSPSGRRRRRPPGRRRWRRRQQCRRRQRRRPRMTTTPPPSILWPPLSGRCWGAPWWSWCCGRAFAGRVSW